MVYDSREKLNAFWNEFKQAWYEDQQTHYWHKDFGNWRITITPDKEEPEKFAWFIFNHIKKIGDHREPFTTRLAAARNAFIHLLVWGKKTSPEVGTAWLQDMILVESPSLLRQAEIVN